MEQTLSKEVVNIFNSQHFQHLYFIPFMKYCTMGLSTLLLLNTLLTYFYASFTQFYVLQCLAVQGLTVNQPAVTKCKFN